MAVLLRFDETRYGSRVNAGMTDEKSFETEETLEKDIPPALRLLRIPGWVDSPRFLKPTYRAGLIGAALGSTCAMLIFPQRQATVFWAFLGAAGYVSFVAASLIVQGRWQEFGRYEER